MKSSFTGRPAKPFPGLRTLRTTIRMGTVTIEDAANAAQVSLTSMQRYELGQRRVDTRVLERLAKYYRVPLADVLSAYEKTREAVRQNGDTPKRKR